MNEKEFEFFLEKNQSRIYRLALRIVENQEEARDVTQETFLKAYQHRNRFRGEAKFSTYLYRIALNSAFTALKKRYHHLPWEKMENLISTKKSPAGQLQEEERAEMVRKTLASLPEKQKAVIHLRIYEGMSFFEIATVLGCRPATARAHYFFGLQKIRKEMKKNYELPQV